MGSTASLKDIVDTLEGHCQTIQLFLCCDMVLQEQQQAQSTPGNMHSLNADIMQADKGALERQQESAAYLVAPARPGQLTVMPVLVHCSHRLRCTYTSVIDHA